MRDNAVGRDGILKHIAELAHATDLPVSADLENGFGDDPRSLPRRFAWRRRRELSVGRSKMRPAGPKGPIYCLEHAVARVEAAVEAAHSLPFPFTLTARAENYLHGNPDLKDTIKRLQAYQEAGADVLYAPGLRTKEDIAEVVRSVDRPVNALMGLQGVQLSQAELSEIGVKRISVGSALARAALGAFLRAARGNAGARYV